MGFLYFFTCGLFGLGWLVDLFRLHSVVRKTNAKHRSGLDKFEDYSLLMAYTFNLFPITGILGGHHFYLGRYFFGVAYFITFGLLGFGWFLDISDFLYSFVEPMRKYTIRSTTVLHYKRFIWTMLIFCGFLLACMGFIISIYGGTFGAFFTIVLLDYSG